MLVNKQPNNASAPYKNGGSYGRYPGISRAPTGKNTTVAFGTKGRGLSGGVFYKNSKYFARPTDESKENETHSCKICNKDFTSMLTLQCHIDSHTKCNVDGCSFAANKETVKQHRKINHNSGLNYKPKETPEDIEKWLLERKRKYSRIGNAEKESETKEGDLKSVKKICQKKNCNTKRNNRSRKRNHKDKTSKKKNKVNNKNHIIKIANVIFTSNRDKWLGNLPPFPGTKAVYDEGNDSLETVESLSEQEIDDNENCISLNENCTEDNVKLEVKTESTYNINEDSVAPPVTVNSVDVSLECTTFKEEEVKLEDCAKLITYETDSDDNTPDETPIIKNCDMETENAEASTFNKITPTKSKRKQKETKTPKEKQNKQIEINTTGNIVQQSLLRKFLANEIRHERNILLQCVRYVVENKFLSINNKIRL